MKLKLWRGSSTACSFYPSSSLWWTWIHIVHLDLKNVAFSICFQQRRIFHKRLSVIDQWFIQLDRETGQRFETAVILNKLKRACDQFLSLIFGSVWKRLCCWIMTFLRNFNVLWDATSNCCFQAGKNYCIEILTYKQYWISHLWDHHCNKLNL